MIIPKSSDRCECGDIFASHVHSGVAGGHSFKNACKDTGGVYLEVSFGVADERGCSEMSLAEGVIPAGAPNYSEPSCDCCGHSLGFYHFYILEEFAQRCDRCVYEGREPGKPL